MGVSVMSFAAATLLPAAVLVNAAIWGGAIWAVAVLTLLPVVLDQLLPERAASRADGAPLNALVALIHLPILLLVVGSAGTAQHGLAEALFLTLAAGFYFGQISYANAHELIHCNSRVLRSLGMASYATLLYGHHVSAHRLVHHVHVGTPADPNTAPLGTGFWSFLPRCAMREFCAGWRAERKLRARQSVIWHPYWRYLAVSAATCGIVVSLAGFGGFGVWITVSAHAALQLILSDYVQHYGLERARNADGTRVPCGPEHAWNAPHSYSAATLFNAPRHSDHHMKPAKGFASLALDRSRMPMLPHALPVMCALAHVPPLWRRMMDPRAKRWRSRGAGQAAANLTSYPHGSSQYSLRTGPDGGRRAGRDDRRRV